MVQRLLASSVAIDSSSESEGSMVSSVRRPRQTSFPSSLEGLRICPEALFVGLLGFRV